MKALPIILAALVGSALCSLEPAGYRLSSTYLPPSFSRRSSSPSSTYLPPPPSSSSSRRQSIYSASQNNYQQQSIYRQRSQSSSSSHRVPSYQPSQDYNTVPSSIYQAPNNRQQQSSSVPSNRYITPSSSKDSFSLPQVADGRTSNVPSTSYGVPEYNGARSRGQHRHNHEDDYSSEPANYNFAYQVNDNYGNDFGHQESRSGAKTRGSYRVLLPDGRKQIVEYEADEAGYRPKISYENVQTDRAAYPGGGPY